MIDVKDKHITVAGAARSGVAAAVFLKKKGADVFVTDNGIITAPARQRLNNHGIPFEEKGHSSKAWKANFLVVSPGVPTKSSIVQYYLQQKKKVYSELEMASWFNRGNIIAVTGTNGKTTTTSWLDHLWTTAGRKHITAGNIGLAFSDIVDDTDDKTDVILEVSSFQLDFIKSFKPHISLLLNITPDHLNRYDNKFENYIQAKLKIFSNQGPNDYLIYSYDDPVIRRVLMDMPKKGKGPKLLAFSINNKVPEGAFVDGNKIIFRQNNLEEVLMNAEEVSLKGQHNLNNGLATALAARASEIKNEAIRDSLMNFEGVEHRLEFVRELDGVRYINDSKATNVNAVWYALDSFQMPMVLIMGGRDKGNDYSELANMLRQKVHTIVAIGEGKDQIQKQLENVVPNIITADTMEQAVRLGRKWAKSGEIVLLSPACSSFDMFDNYEHRGKEFKRYVNNL
ncbi:MAG TPA: UDP-N-acetylmuramoyl-L-alanine--D-glutamate ligase [Balneolales bacterium]|nr:UDP-N-acetylmuramoyl-L-alanine--D-glutamate ligase [Balneolales bacterium]